MNFDPAPSPADEDPADRVDPDHHVDPVDPVDPAAAAIQNSIALLEETHQFPCGVMIKVIGYAEATFAGRIVAAVSTCILTEQEGEGLDWLPAADAKLAAGTGATMRGYFERLSGNEKYLAITMEPLFASAHDVLRAYEQIGTVEGVVMVL
jgi:putative lipoic acid-binding regulatory protein